MLVIYGMGSFDTIDIIIKKDEGNVDLSVLAIGPAEGGSLSGLHR
jgi:hypothetical protein